MFNTRPVRRSEGAPSGGGSGAEAPAPAAESPVITVTDPAADSAPSGSDTGWEQLRAQVGLTPEPAASVPAPATVDPAAAPAPSGEAAPPAVSAPTAEAQRIAELESRLNRFGPVIERLESEGYTDATAVETYLTQQQSQNALATHMSGVEAKLQARIDAGTLTPEEALEDYQTEMTRQQQVISAQQITSKYAAIQTEQAFSGALAAHPILAKGRSADGKTLGKGEAIVRALHKSNPQVEISRIAEYVAGNLTSIQEMAVAEHAAKTAQTQQAPPLLNGGGAGNGSGGSGAPLSMTQRMLQKAGISFGGS
ncbi:MAG: hypothetical protein V4671_15890 [Armatimonadota bacterium]